MFEDELTLTGFYKDEDLRVDVTLENPINYGLEDNLLYFSIELMLYNDITLELPEMNFYILTEKNFHIFNEVKRLEVESEIYDDDNNVTYGIKNMITFEFKPEFLYYQIYIGFRYNDYNGIIFIPVQP